VEGGGCCCHSLTNILYLWAVGIARPFI
jgi:hypothetical protein